MIDLERLKAAKAEIDAAETEMLKNLSALNMPILVSGVLRPGEVSLMVAPDVYEKLKALAASQPDKGT